MVAELDRALAVPEVVEVEGAVAVFVIVVGVRVVVAEPSRVDRVHRRGAETANLVDEGVVGLTRIPRDAVWLCSRRLEDQLLLLVEGAHEVLDHRRRHPLRSDVHVEARPRVDLRSGLAHRPHDLLKDVHVRDAQDRRDHLCGGSAQGAVAHHLPFASIGHRHHPVGKVPSFVVCRAADRLGHDLCRSRLADPFVLKLAPVGEACQFRFRYRHFSVSFLCFRIGPSGAFYGSHDAVITV